MFIYIFIYIYIYIYLYIYIFIFYIRMVNNVYGVGIADICKRSAAFAEGLRGWMRRRSYDDAVVAKGGLTLAVQLPRSHADFVPLLVAASRSGIPFVLLSTDLPDKELERQRNSSPFGSSETYIIKSSTIKI